MEQRKHPSEMVEVVERRPLTGNESVAEIRHAVRDCLAGLGVDSDLAYDCLVAVTEACTNALIHGKRTGAGSVPNISWRIDDSQAQFSIEDFSRGWPQGDRLSVVVSEASPVAGRVGGFGLHLMADLMDEVNVSIDAAGTRVTMTKHL